MNTKTIKLPCFDIAVELNYDEEGKPSSGVITSDLGVDTEDEGDDLYNAAIDGITSMILGHAMAGIDITSPAYIEGIETAVNACANNF